MSLSKICCAVAIAAMALSASAAHAQSEAAYPARAVRFIVPFTPGGPNDILARLVAKELTESWSQPVLVDNRPGGGTIIGSDFVAKAPADGYNLLIVSTSTAINVSLKASLPYDTAADFAPVILLAQTPNVLVSNLAVPARSVAELLALARAKPGQIAYASGGAGSATDLAGILLGIMGKVEMINVAYKGAGPASIDLVGGQVAWMFGTLLPTLPMIRDGQVRALAVSGKHRSPSLPDVPTVAETLPGFEATSWYGVFARAGTPAAILTKLNRDIAATLGSKAMRDYLDRDGVEAGGGTREDFAAYFKSEVAKWSGVIKQAGITPQ
jgi:tripartite-type tricarboxylate transporter receptor subunit TctC